MNAEKIAEKARKSLSKFCIEECKSYCCRKGYLVLNNDEVDIVTQGRKIELEEKKILRKINEEKYSLFIEPCPSFKDDKCLIHGNKKRPKNCKDYPLFIEGTNVKLSPRCPAVKMGLLYPYTMQLVRLGYKILNVDDFNGFEVDMVEFLNKEKSSEVI
jgi:Fe-S-cluster containining protein